MRTIFSHKTERSDISHAILETNSRIRKALKIQAIIESTKDLSVSKVLDIGTGSGHIAQQLSKTARSVVSVDLVDERKEKEGYDFRVVHDETLPFEDAVFDIVVTNHVVEHTPNQRKHLSEVYRVLKPGGIIYLATPNKLWPTDPHYKLPFISWMPRKVSQRYLNLIHQREWDIYPLSHFGIQAYFPYARINNALPVLLKSKDRSTLDTMSYLADVLRWLPGSVLEITRYFSPTLIYLIKKPKEQ